MKPPKFCIVRVERSAEFLEALDRISELFLDGGLLNRLPTVAVENSRQEGEGVVFWLQTSGIHFCKVWHNFLFKMLCLT